MDFKRVKGLERNPRYSFFGGSNLGNGVSLGITGSFRGMTSSEGKKLIRAKFGSARNLGPDGDGKVTWEYYFTHWDAPGIVFTVYDWKGGLSCGFGIPMDVEAHITKPYADKLNRMLTELTDYCFGRV